PEGGDGVRAFIVSSRAGELKAAAVHHTKLEMSVQKIEVKANETIDFIVDIGSGLKSDQFLWAPRIASGDETWDARADFSGPTTQPPFLNAWEQYAQVLLLSNEFCFLD